MVAKVRTISQAALKNGSSRRQPCRRRATRYGQRITTFLYLHSADLDDARRFYSEVVGLTEIFVSSEDRVVGYRVGDLQITIEERTDAELPASGWSKQLGWDGGTSPTPSWGVELDAVEFGRAVDAARASGTTCWQPEPQWVGYWSFPVRDPMGHTVELSSTDHNAWPSGSSRVR